MSCILELEFVVRISCCASLHIHHSVTSLRQFRLKICVWTISGSPYLRSRIWNLRMSRTCSRHPVTKAAVVHIERDGYGVERDFGTKVNRRLWHR